MEELMVSSLSEDMGRFLDSLNTQLEVDAQEAEHQNPDQISPASSTMPVTPQPSQLTTPPSNQVDKDSDGHTQKQNSGLNGESSPNSMSSGSSGYSSSKSASSAKKSKIDQIALSLANADTGSESFSTPLSTETVQMEIPSFPAEIDWKPNQSGIKQESLNDLEPQDASTNMMNRNVNSQRPYSCDICGLAFTQKGNLSRHKQIHTPFKPFKCDLCSYASRRKDALINHRSTHCVDKPFKCCKCSQAYKQKSSLRDHLRSTHRLTADQIRDIIPPDLPPNAILSTNVPIKRKANPGSPTSGMFAFGSPSEMQSGSEFGSALDSCGASSEGNRTPSPASSGAENADTSSINEDQDLIHVKKRLVETSNGRRSSVTLAVAADEDDAGVQDEPLNFCQSRTPPSFSERKGSEEPEDLSVKTESKSPKRQDKFANEQMLEYLVAQEKMSRNSGSPNVLGVDVSKQFLTMSMSSPVSNFISGSATNASANAAVANSGLFSNYMSLAAQQAQAYQAALAKRGQNPNFYEAYMAALKTASPQHPIDSRQQQQQQLWKLYNSATSSLLNQWQLAQQKSPNQSQVLSQKTNQTNNTMQNASSSSLVTSTSSQQPKQEFISRSPDSSTPSQCASCRAANSSAYSCETCQIIFSDEVMYTIHMGIHTKSNPLQCNICGFLASTRYEFASHVARGDHLSKDNNRESNPVSSSVFSTCAQ